MTSTDEELVARSIGGDSDSFNELVLRWERPIYALAYRTIGREEDARDVCQETFLRAFRALPGFRGQPLNLWDLSLIKNFSITEKVKFQLRGEFLNAFNHPQFADPNTDPKSSDFGKTTGQNNLPRNVQIGLKVVF